MYMVLVVLPLCLLCTVSQKLALTLKVYHLKVQQEALQVELGVPKNSMQRSCTHAGILQRRHVMLPTST